ncbi:hypothetical protein Pint_32780 [Pistacia integerrima]|uniref:Uncharacterized protein n=1 Tax=Pistacia integerrima TaxID=434235 RepID=A0ACC0XM95_9ROSI|nr:hypothetical protein Pint_32780 [Pistacia integerrima]
MNSFSTGSFIRADHKISIISRSFRTSQLAYTKLIEIYTHDRALHSGKVLHAHLIITGLARLTHFASKLIAFYTECRKILYARKLFDKIPKTNIHRWIALIGAYARRGYHQEALDVFNEMQGQRVTPNVVTWNSLIAGFSQKGDQVMVSKLFGLMHNNGVEPDVVSWTSVISGLVQNFCNDQAFDMFKQMLGMGFYPSSATISSILAACASVANVKRLSSRDRLFGFWELYRPFCSFCTSWDNCSTSTKVHHYGIGKFKGRCVMFFPSGTFLSLAKPNHSTAEKSDVICKSPWPERDQVSAVRLPAASSVYCKLVIMLFSRHN